MNEDWQGLFGRALGGDALDDAERAQLDAALDDAQIRQEAIAWLQLDATLHEHLQPARDESQTRSRELLLAKAILREKHRTVARAASTRRSRAIRLAPMAAAVTLLFVAVFFALRPTDGPGEPQAFGDFRVMGAEINAMTGGSLQRGARLITGSDGARLALGGYCELNLKSHSEVSIRGAPGNERIELHRGEVHAQVRPERGSFTLLTPLGPIEVKGTEFITTVDLSGHSQGEHVMKAQARRVVVTVAVLTGAVVCHFGDGPAMLQQGANQVFAGAKEDARGAVVATTDLSLTLKLTSGEQVTFHVPESKTLTVREVSQLSLGDKVGVIWIEEEGKKWIQDVIAKGVIEGMVTGRGDIWIEIKPEGKKTVRLIPPWLAATENRDGGLDREVLKKLGQARVGDLVSVNWEMPEGQRVMDLKVLKRGSRKDAERDVAKGVLEGVVTGLGDNWIEVTVEGQDPVRMIPPWREGGLDREVLKKLGTARVGDRVSLTWAMLEGKRVVDLKVIQRGSREKSNRDMPEGRIPMGLRGFKGILFGKFAEKNEEKMTFTLKVQKVGRVWRENRAKNAEAAIGKSLPIELHRESRLLSQHQETLHMLKNGDVVEVELFHLKDNVLSVIELLKKVD